MIYYSNHNIKSCPADTLQQLQLGRFGQSPANSATLYLLQELLEVGLELVGTLHASMAEQAPA